MTVSVVTARKGGTREAMIAATRKLKTTVEKHGAEDLTLNQVVAGPDSGQWLIRIIFASWESFGKAMQLVSNDKGAQDAVAGLDSISEVTSRRMLASVDL
jgi:hypothetical protein